MKLENVDKGMGNTMNGKGEDLFSVNDYHQQIHTMTIINTAPLHF